MVDMLYLEKCLKAWYVTVKLYVMSTILDHNVTNGGNTEILICFSALPVTAFCLFWMKAVSGCWAFGGCRLESLSDH